MFFQSDCVFCCSDTTQTLLDALHELVRHIYVMALLFLSTNINSMSAANTIDS